jgi:trehalose/maltose hydrolase-like predicted phosphorylase
MNPILRDSWQRQKIHKEKSNKMQQCIKILLFHIYMKLKTCFRRHTAHHQVPETALAAFSFSYVEGCWDV